MMHCLHCVRRLLIQSRMNVRALLMSVLLLSQFGLAMGLASAQGTEALSVNLVQPNSCPPPQTNCQNSPPNVPPHVPPNVPPGGGPSVPPGVPSGVPSGRPPAINAPRLPMTGFCPFPVASKC